MKNIKAVAIFIAHLASYAKAYASGITSLVAMILASDTTHWPTWARVTLYVVAAVFSFLGVAVLPNRSKGVTIGQAVAMDGAALAQARSVLKDVQLPGYVNDALDKAEQVAPIAGAVLDAAASVSSTPVTSEDTQTTLPPSMNPAVGASGEPLPPATS